ncbi:MAG: hypothetical protein AAF171_05680 [Cyanobacteria bacterium P01_A01_bin.116]
MANASPAIASAKQAKKGITIAGIFLIVMMIFGAQRQLIATQFLNAPAGSSAETVLIDVAGKHSPTVDVITQLQYTQRALYKAEVIAEGGTLITEVSQDVTSRNDASRKQVDITDWPNPDKIKVRLTVANQNITATPPAGVTAAQVPVIFEVNIYHQWLNRRFLWPALFACIGLWIIVTLAERRERTAW